MTARLLLLTLFLSVGCLTARGQDLRTGVATDDGGFLAAGDYLAWLDATGNILRKRPLERPLTALASCGGRLYAPVPQNRIPRAAPAVPVRQSAIG